MRNFTTCGKLNQHFLCCETRAIRTPVQTQSAPKPLTKLKARRLETGFTQLDVATYAGVKLKTYQHYEIGRRKLENANYYTIKRIAKALVCGINDII